MVEGDDVERTVKSEKDRRNIKFEGREHGYVDFNVRTTKADDDEEDRPDERMARIRKGEKPPGTAAGRPFRKAP
ncbi:hypothetical protein GALMADRAFT_241784 [Galerina marginata CBS 339.88]|uniref:Uncharacterized protein n=1 Tax=Galerina marginata (strain CBS 339.88) TaxID=685588 RepID=A0A067TFW4_GALM3|nr:hypothetical protein GALMADRAFT_241784 [Galerina marginata CBS 339.88]